MHIMNPTASLLSRKGTVMGCLFILALIFVLSLAAQTAGQYNQNAANPQAESMLAEGSEGEGTEAGQSLTVWNIIQMTDWLFWPFVMITAAGLLLVTFRALQEYQEKSRMQDLLRQLVHVRDMRTLVHTVQTSHQNRASRLIHQMIKTFNKTGRAEPIREDATQYLSSQREAFETFNRVMGFLSDSAGALGLLGTVWGIFETFHGGKLDGPTILRGMSISLVTTLVGLIISLVLNLGVTAIFALFNKQMNLLTTRAEEVRQALLNLERRSQGKARPTATRPRQQPDIVEVDDNDYEEDLYADVS